LAILALLSLEKVNNFAIEIEQIGIDSNVNFRVASEMLLSVDLRHSCYLSAVFKQRKAVEGLISLLGVLL